MATPTTLPDTPDVVSGNTRPNMFGTGVAESVGIQQMIDDIYNAWAKLGIGATTPDAAHKSLKATAAGTSSWDYHSVVKLDEVGPIGSAQATIPFSSINQNFRSLKLVVQARGTQAAASVSVLLRFNADSGNNYDDQYLNGNASSASAAEGFGDSSILLGFIPAASAGANLASTLVAEIPNYRGTAFHKSVSCQNAFKRGTSTGEQSALLPTGHWRNAAAITSITLLLSAGNFEVGSWAALYGEP